MRRSGLRRGGARPAPLPPSPLHSSATPLPRPTPSPLSGPPPRSGPPQCGGPQSLPPLSRPPLSTYPQPRALNSTPQPRIRSPLPRGTRRRTPVPRPTDPRSPGGGVAGIRPPALPPPDLRSPLLPFPGIRSPALPSPALHSPAFPSPEVCTADKAGTGPPPSGPTGATRRSAPRVRSGPGPRPPALRPRLEIRSAGLRTCGGSAFRTPALPRTQIDRAQNFRPGSNPPRWISSPPLRPLSYGTVEKLRNLMHAIQDSARDSAPTARISESKNYNRTRPPAHRTSAPALRPPLIGGPLHLGRRAGERTSAGVLPPADRGPAPLGAEGRSGRASAGALHPRGPGTRATWGGGPGSGPPQGLSTPRGPGTRATWGGGPGSGPPQRSSTPRGPRNRATWGGWPLGAGAMVCGRPPPVRISETTYPGADIRCMPRNSAPNVRTYIKTSRLVLDRR